MSDAKLFEIIRYSIYCHFFEFDPSDEQVYNDYVSFWSSPDIEKHYGDCTNQPTACLKCQAEWIDDDAGKAFKGVKLLGLDKESDGE